ncbi:MAG: PKD domain-containing protein [Verrucomicrobia bacterium]|nr:PKD domain-containing protein [Verrucomicrobiota bacterium]
MTLEFGDGSPAMQVEAEATHVYATPGRYTAKLISLGPDREPLELRMQVVIE